MTRLRQEERGGILMLSAILIPVFIVMTAMIVDVGQWYTHKRQLQNRADSAAFAAGIEYGKNWKACVQNGDAALKASTAREIANKARQFAADPEASDYAPDPLPGTLYNSGIATQSKLDVVINSTTYDDDTDQSDDGDGSAATSFGSPCFKHSGDPISPGGGHWTDVRVKENDLPSILGSIGLPLSRNVARARIEVRPALSGHRFLPLAVPDNVIMKVQVRYYDECRNTLLATRDLAQLSSADSSAYSLQGGGSLWALPNPAQPTVGDTSQSFPLTVPSVGGCGQDYLPVGVEVRIASQPNVDLNQSCAALQSARYADCFRRLSQFRVYNDGGPNEPRLTVTKVLGGCGAPGDGYFSTMSTGVNACDYDVSAEVWWGNRAAGNLDVPANFTVSADGQNLPMVSWGGSSGPSIYASSGGVISGAAGANVVDVTLNWRDTNTSHSWGGSNCRNGNNNPCVWNSTEAAHRTFFGTSANAGAVALVRTSMEGFVAGLPGAPLENVATGGATGDPPSPINVYPTIGIRSTLKTGTYTILRTEDSQGSQLLQCDPAVSQGQEFTNFLNGCNPWYAKNSFTDPNWWNSTTQQCPNPGLWFGSGTMPAPYGANSAANPWRCVPLAPGSSNGQTGNWMSVATENCDRIGTNQCQDIVCNYDGNYDGKPGDPNGWVQLGGDSSYPRVVSLFIIPYQSLKGVTGAGETAPVLGFASFYVMNWEGANNQKSDQCPDTTWNGVTVPALEKGTVSGTFVETVNFEPGPVDPNAICEEGQLIPCRVTLVR